MPKEFWAGLDSATGVQQGDRDTASEWKNFQKLNALTITTIRNEGNLPATKVRVKFGENGIASVIWDDGKTTLEEFKTEIELEDIPIDKTVVIKTWTSFAPEEVSVVHSKGRKTVSFADSLIGYYLSWGVYLFAGAVVLFFVFEVLLDFLNDPLPIPKRASISVTVDPKPESQDKALGEVDN